MECTFERQVAVNNPNPADNAARWRSQSAILAAWALPNAIMVSLINIALPEIQAAFEVGPGALTWAASGYIVAGAIGAVVNGRLADVFGLRNVALFCMLVFALTSICVALAPSFPWLVAFRVPQGAVGMALPTIGMGGIIFLLPPEARGRAVGWMMASFGLGVVIGSVAGGFVIAWAGWRAPFVITGILALGLIPPTLALIPRVQPSANPPRLDKTGGLLVTIAVGSTLIAVNQLPRPTGFEIGMTALAVAVVFWVAFLWQVQRSKHPFVDPVILRSLPFLRSCAFGGIVQGQFVLAGFVFPLALKRLYNYSVADVGLLMAAGFLTVFILGYTGPRISARLGNRGTLVLAAACSVVGSMGSSLLGVTSVPGVAVLYVFLAAAYTLVQPVMITAAGRILPSAYAGAGMGFYNFAYFAAGAFCVALSGGVIERRFTSPGTWTGLHAGPAVGYVDALLVLAGLSVTGLVLLVLVWNDPGIGKKKETLRQA